MSIEPLHGTVSPKNILLASDTTSEGERALERATLLADHWRADLTILQMADEAGSSGMDAETELPSRTAAADRLPADVGAAIPKATVIVDEDDPVEAIVRAVEEEGCDFIVTGDSDKETPGSFEGGKALADRLPRRLRIPLLLVKKRATQTYARIVIATDFSDSSRHALEVAARFFPETALTVFHAYDLPISGPITDSDSHPRDHHKTVLKECKAFLRTVNMPTDRLKDPHIVIERGTPEDLLPGYVRNTDVDLVVLGAQGRSQLIEVLIGSAASRIIDEVPCDILIVR